MLQVNCHSVYVTIIITIIIITSFNFIVFFLIVWCCIKVSHSLVAVGTVGIRGPPWAQHLRERERGERERLPDPITASLRESF